MAEDTFDTRYWQTDLQQESAVASEAGRVSVMSPVCLNREEFLIVVEMVEAIAIAGLDKIEFIECDEDTGEAVTMSPGLSDVEEEMLNLITDTYAPLIAAARMKGRIR